MRHLIGSAAALAAAVLLFLAVVPAASAHHPGEPAVSVPSEAIPGTPITVVGAYLPEGVDVTLRLVAGDADVELGTVTTDATGAFTAAPTIPDDFPSGPARVVATDFGDTPVAYEVVVGPRPEDPAAAGDAPGATTLAIGILATLTASLAVLGLVVRTARRRGARGRA